MALGSNEPILSLHPRRRPPPSGSEQPLLAGSWLRDRLLNTGSWWEK